MGAVVAFPGTPLVEHRIKVRIVIFKNISAEHRPGDRPHEEGRPGA